VNSILVIRAGALGDVLLALPALHALCRRCPDSRIHVVGYPDIWQVAGPLVNGITSIDHPRFASLFTAEPSSDLRIWLSGFDAAIAWMVRDPTHALQAAGIRTTHASPYPPPGVHAATWLLQTLDLPHDPAFVASLLPDITSTIAGDPADIPANTVFIHPGAGAIWKRWPADRFAAVADVLVGRGHNVAIVEGPADAEAVTEMQARAATPYPIIGESSLPRLASILSRAATFIGNDSGVTHLAALAGAPTVALFGPTDPISWAPLGRVTVLRRCAAHATGYPLGEGQIRVCDDPNCMAGISVDDVLAAISSLPSGNQSDTG
jgi:ADP-heptose:LPS heptosyltransferase